MKNIVTLIVCTLGLGYYANAQTSNDLTLLIAPLDIKKQSSYQLLFRKDLNRDDWKFRGGLRVLIDTDRETRADTIFRNSGTIQYDLSVGLQRNLQIEGLKKINAYTALDGYWNSDFRQLESSDYYGYFWNFGVRPTVGLSYDPFKNIRLSVESRSNFNVNLQDYNARGNNSDRRFTFNPLDHMALGLGYLF